MHVGCVAQFRVQVSRFSELLCFSCRHSRCGAARRAAKVPVACECEVVPGPSRRRIPCADPLRDYALCACTTNHAREASLLAGVSCSSGLRSASGTARSSSIPGVDLRNRRRFGFDAYNASQLGEALYSDVNMVCDASFLHV